MRGWIERARHFLTEGVWTLELAGLSRVRARGTRALRVLVLAVRGVLEDRCLYQASALAFVTVLSVVPVGAFAFSVAKGLGAYEDLVDGTLRPFLSSAIGSPDTSPAAARLHQAVEELLALVSNTSVRSLGLWSLVFLAWTVVKLLGTVERAFNDIWGVKRPRSLLRRVADSVAMAVLVPLLLVTATTAVTALETTRFRTFLTETLELGPLLEAGLKLVPWASMCLGFGLLYLFLPNTRVRFSSATLGGLVGGTLWYVAQILHVRFQIGLANYNAIYSGFAAVPVFLLWVYVSWGTVLFGAEFAFAHQNEPAYRQIARSKRLDPPREERLALRALARIHQRFRAAEPPWTLDALAADLETPELALAALLGRLEARGIVAPVGEGFETGILPGRAPSTVRLKDVLDALWGRGGAVDLPPRSELDRHLDRALDHLEEACSHSPANTSLDEILGVPPGPRPTATEPDRPGAGDFRNVPTTAPVRSENAPRPPAEQ